MTVLSSHDADGAARLTLASARMRGGPADLKAHMLITPRRARGAALLAAVVLLVAAGTAQALRPGTSAAAAAAAAYTPQTRTHYVAADEVLWNYAPDGRDDITGAPFDDAAKVFVQGGQPRQRPHPGRHAHEVPGGVMGRLCRLCAVKAGWGPGRCAWRPVAPRHLRGKARGD